MGFTQPQEVIEGIYQLRGERPSCHVYLVRSKAKNLLIDTGTSAAFEGLAMSLGAIGLLPTDIDLVINTHEHFDHIGANVYFSQSAIIGAHGSAAIKLERSDEYVTMYDRVGARVQDEFPTPHLWLEDGTLIDLDDFHLRVIHTPGHTSGSICLYDPIRRLLFSGDTVYAQGILPAIAPSGSAGDYVSSLHGLLTQKIEMILPGHGRISNEPESDLFAALEYAKSGLSEARTLGGVDTWSESTPLSAFL